LNIFLTISVGLAEKFAALLQAFGRELASVGYGNLLQCGIAKTFLPKNVRWYKI